MDHFRQLRRRAPRPAKIAAWYLLAGAAVSIVVALALSRLVDVRLATPVSAAESAWGDQEWSVDRWDRTGATQILSIRKVERVNWSPWQATGPPDTPSPGDCVTAWASALPDAPGDWLELGYPKTVLPAAVNVYESFNPGAICRVTAFKPDGTEVDAWRGNDPTPTSATSGVSKIPLAVSFPINRIKIYLASEKVPGWNEIDAAGLVGADGQFQWANSARASSFYGTGKFSGVPFSSPAPADLIPRWSGLERPALEPHQALANDECRMIDARGWPMLALYSQRTIPASVGGSISPSSASSTSVTGAYSSSLSPVSSLLPIVSFPPTPADIAPIPLHPIWLGLAVDAIAFGSALLLLRWLLTAPRRVVLELSRLRQGRCIACGYDLGYDFVHGCPECGWRRGPGSSPYV